MSFPREGEFVTFVQGSSEERTLRFMSGYFGTIGDVYTPVDLGERIIARGLGRTRT